ELQRTAPQSHAGQSRPVDRHPRHQTECHHPAHQTGRRSAARGSAMSHIARLLLVALLLAGCSSQPPAEPRHYLLRSDQPLATRALTADREYAMGTVSISPYLDQSGMVLETGAGELRPARQHLWAEPLYDAVRGYLMVEISQARGRDLLPLDA